MHTALKLVWLLSTSFLTISISQETDELNGDQNAISSVPSDNNPRDAFHQLLDKLDNPNSAQCNADSSTEEPLDWPVSDSIPNGQIVRRQSCRASSEHKKQDETPSPTGFTLQAIPLSSLLDNEGNRLCTAGSYPFPVTCGGAEVGSDTGNFVEGALGCVIGESDDHPTNSGKTHDNRLQVGCLMKCHLYLLGNRKKSPGFAAVISSEL